MSAFPRRPCESIVYACYRSVCAVSILVCMYSFYVVLRLEARIWRVLGKCLTTTAVHCFAFYFETGTGPFSLSSALAFLKSLSFTGNPDRPSSVLNLLGIREYRPNPQPPTLRSTFIFFKTKNISEGHSVPK